MLYTRRIGDVLWKSEIGAGQHRFATTRGRESSSWRAGLAICLEWRAGDSYGPKVQLMICVVVWRPVEAVKPTRAVLAPTVAGMLMGQEVAKDALAVRSLMLRVSVAPL